ncbi:C45 family autoproteolytic acyltransferase/hydolase [Flavobacterium terrae]|uniref:Acyl-coenzyme A:6-aminopenicillanic acid acyl-transferase n=1 Tax=Flavobacterium terrae TaxID=415425 RepID=A0A1M6D2X1_9FLAO|nr:C45 family peptidase [Flavobacterium terrae]SHI67463.1 Acyl-coenzyme A:6-aminopenicillanic acid acyl-transferase [Flavobacterium terrae]
MRKVIHLILILGVLLSLSSCGTSKSIHHQPKVTGYNQAIPGVVKHSDTVFSSGTNYLVKNKQNIWELYVSGDPLQRGLLMGALAEPLVKKQESLFFSKVKEIVPSNFKQNLLRQFLKWYNRKLYLNVPEEYKTEIYGVSQYASDDFNSIAPKYLRSLYLHGAHDIGHAMQDLALVGCSSLALWGDKTEDGELLLGRNFDFYAGDEFAKDKVVAFIKPDSGHPFMMVTWGGMIGVVSGMNKEGLTITINAGKSKIPLVAKTPISIVAREILQYASTINEAIAIAKKRQVFVSESIMIGSARDKKAVLIEMSPKQFGVYEVPNQNNQLVCTNHFQSDVYKDDERNNEHIIESHSKYRYDRVEELLDKQDKMNPQKMADILRNKEGLHNKKIGYGNEKSLNQLLAHHAIIFKPESRMVWVSSNPYQLGDFVAYDLNKIFSKKENDFVALATDSLTIPRDKFVYSEEFKNYEKYRVQSITFDKIIDEEGVASPEFISDYQKLNPEHWIVYYKAGDYYYQKKEFQKAKEQFETALTKEITTLTDKKNIEKYLKKINKKLK